MPVFAAPLEALSAFGRVHHYSRRMCLISYSPIAFIVSGVPFYLISRYVQDPNGVPRPVRWVGDRIGKLVGYNAGTSGYMRAATEGDEMVEMLQR